MITTQDQLRNALRATLKQLEALPLLQRERVLRALWNNREEAGSLPVPLAEVLGDRAEELTQLLRHPEAHLPKHPLFVPFETLLGREHLLCVLPATLEPSSYVMSVEHQPMAFSLVPYETEDQATLNPSSFVEFAGNLGARFFRTDQLQVFPTSNDMQVGPTKAQDILPIIHDKTLHSSKNGAVVVAHIDWVLTMSLAIINPRATFLTDICWMFPY